ncbi:hypothetical protein N665_1100s0004 [Sinapis alba]|nr:hypothetical protein N665_1100s0004 [Sinapis alba]
MCFEQISGRGSLRLVPRCLGTTGFFSFVKVFHRRSLYLVARSGVGRDCVVARGSWSRRVKVCGVSESLGRLWSWRLMLLRSSSLSTFYTSVSKVFSP